MSEQRRSGTESLGKPDASEKHRRSEVRHRHGGGLRLVPGATRQTQACLGLSDSFLVGHTVAAASTGQVVEKVPAGQTPISRQQLVERIMADALPVRFQLQMHKFVWPPDQRGV